MLSTTDITYQSVSNHMTHAGHWSRTLWHVVKSGGEWPAKVEERRSQCAWPARFTSYEVGWVRETGIGRGTRTIAYQRPKTIGRHKQLGLLRSRFQASFIHSLSPSDIFSSYSAKDVAAKHLICPLSPWLYFLWFSRLEVTSVRTVVRCLDSSIYCSAGHKNPI